VATRSPWPSQDGGRVLMARTLEGLHARGHTVTLVAPAAEPNAQTDPVHGSWLRSIFVPVRVRSLVPSVLRGLVHRDPGSMTRHAHAAVGNAVEHVLSHEHVDVVHVEQLQAVSNAAPALRHRVPIVLRAENVESDLWKASSLVRPHGRLMGGWETRKVARYERAWLERMAIR